MGETAYIEESGNSKARLTEGAVKGILVRLTIPMTYGILSIHTFHLVDKYFIGKLGVSELAAMGFVTPVVGMIFGITMGIGVGASAVISRTIGQGDHGRVQRLTTDTLLLAVLTVALSSGAGLLTIKPVFGLLGATPEIISLIRQYMTIWYPGMIFIVVPIVGNQIIRATGDTKTPSMIMVVAAGANILLDPVFIFGLGPIPRMELAGGALATVIGRSITLVVALWVLIKREKLIVVRMPSVKEMFSSWGRILHIGLPAGCTNAVIPIAIGIVIRLLSSYGKEAVAAYGVGAVISIFSFAVVYALATVLAPFVGQNWGAGKYKRIDLGIKYSQFFVIAWGAFMFMLLALFAEPVASLFTKNERAVSLLTIYLRIVPAGYALRAVYVLSTSTLNVLHKPLHASALSLGHLFVLYVPLAYIGSYLIGIKGIYWAEVIAPCAIGIAAFFWLKKVVAGIRQAPAGADRSVDI